MNLFGKASSPLWQKCATRSAPTRRSCKNDGPGLPMTHWAMVPSRPSWLARHPGWGSFRPGRVPAGVG
jgi:hypothetical protein